MEWTRIEPPLFLMQELANAIASFCVGNTFKATSKPVLIGTAVIGATTMILSSEIEQGTVIAVPSDNLVLYYVDPATEFARLGLVYTTDGETNLIGFHAQGNYGTAVGESFALMGMKLWFEYADGVAIVEIDDSF